MVVAVADVPTVKVAPEVSDRPILISPVVCAFPISISPVWTFDPIFNAVVPAAVSATASNVPAISFSAVAVIFPVVAVIPPDAEVLILILLLQFQRLMTHQLLIQSFQLMAE